MKRLTCLSLLVLLTSVSPARSTIVTINSHPGDAQIVQNTFGTGSFAAPQTTGPLIVGGAGSSQSRTSILFFQLPEVQILGGASLNVTVDLIDPANSSQHADLWGLGYLSSTTLQNAWALESNSDPNAIGGGLGISDRVKIQDNFLDGFLGNPALPHTLSTSAVGDANLQSFLESLYAAGAQPGDYAVLRVNADFNITTFDRWRFASGDSESGAPTLLLDLVSVPEPATGLLVALLALLPTRIFRHQRNRR